MTTSRELIDMLTERGLSKRAIGRAIGRDSSLISQVASGRKPGANLTGSLDELRRRLEAGQTPDMVTAPARRKTSSGVNVRVRRPVVIGGHHWATGTVERQASQSGARGLMKAVDVDAGGEVAVTVSFNGAQTVYNGSGGTDTHGHGGLRESAGRPVTMHLGDGSYVAQGVRAAGGDLTGYVLARMSQAGFIGDPVAARDNVDAIELRSWYQ